MILDLDGTVVPSRPDGMPSEKVINALIQAKDHLIVSAASGRPFFLAKNILEVLKMDGPCVLDGGAQILDVASGKILFEEFLSIEKQKEILTLCAPYKYQFYDSGDATTSGKLPEHVAAKTGKLVISGVTDDDVIKILEELTAIEGIAAHPVHLSWDGHHLKDIHITNIEATKKTAIEKLLEILQVKHEEVIGVGDGLNDMPLFSSVGFKVAMGNAPQELKDQADYVAPSLDEDGVADVVQKFVLE